jgi:hypothetical protein
MGAWCGYVGVAEGHPAFHKDYDDVKPYPRVHGGLTFASVCQVWNGQEELSQAVCHVPGPGEPDHVWWLGFDCGHHMDFVPELHLSRLGREFDEGFARAFPELARRAGAIPETYRTLAYVRNECASLAAQLVKMGRRRRRAAA